jgi:hypothetical protein
MKFACLDFVVNHVLLFMFNSDNQSHNFVTLLLDISGRLTF